MKVKDVYVDADHLVYMVAYSQSNKSGFAGKYNGGFTGKKRKGKIDITRQKHHFQTLVDEYLEIAQTESVFHKWTVGKIHVIMSDKTNFRYRIYKHYKSGRTTEHTELFYALRKWARKHYRYEPDTEADDVVSYYARKGHLVFTTDKDVYKGNKGYFFNAHHRHRNWVRTTKKEAEHFFKLQTLAGDTVDTIPALYNVGLSTAEKLLTKFNGDVLAVYKSKGKTKEYMIQMARLVCMSQWSPKKGVKLWGYDE